MRFGMFIPQGWRMDLVGIPAAQHWGVMAGLARAADANNMWESIWLHDHFRTVPEATHEPTHEAWTLTAALAAVTGRVRLGQMSTTMGYRNPVLLAKMAATVDIISEGRLDVGLSAGWYEEEWLAYGYGFPSAGERIGMLAEGVEILRQAWTTGTVTFKGRHYNAENAIVAPRPLQGTLVTGSPANGIPMCIAGGGEKKTLRLAAQHADYTNFEGTAEKFAHKTNILTRHCTDVDRDPATITRTATYTVIVGTDLTDLNERLRAIGNRMVEGGITQTQAHAQVEQLRAQPLVGTPDKICDYLDEMRAIGLDYAIAYFPEAAYDSTGLELFEHYVIPEFRPRKRMRLL
ncbi:Pyrimidine monooxygenase RutA [Dermatophilus congolensis]|uniref:Pyrimidine monooxygenase RutA n=1 Tax=Dermatophilus congolensis TaxID=1863 RepID=A0AA46BLA2_9MICO|nr:TIGR03560 family F420-dependent LLM class oxidoreductase [Dermatophilus congolensis]STD03836.1 Pyrimidine monooxygenase RutA [Dermatophilus congolensis]